MTKYYCHTWHYKIQYRILFTTYYAIFTGSCANLGVIMILTYSQNCIVVKWLAAHFKCGKLWVRAPVGSNIDYKIGICCFSTKHAALRRKSKNCLARNQDNVSEWSDMCTHGLLFQWASTIKIQQSVLV